MSLNRLPSVFRRTSTVNAKAGQTNGSAEVIDKEYQNTDAPKALKEFREQIKKGIPISLSISSVAGVIDLIRNKDSIDDRKLLLEHALTFVSRLEDGPFAQSLQNKIIELLYNDLSHPPSTSVGNKYAWREADGSCNNIDIPDMGKADTPYSRSVQQINPLPTNQLPDPGLVFDTLLKREKFVKHPGGLSSLMFSFAALVIHSVFRTSHRDVNINGTSSYVDLAPLYGNNHEEQSRIRVLDGRGLLYPDTFAEDRLLLLPPAVCTILVLFSRNHNYIARKLLEINERGNWVDPKTLSLDDPKQKKQLVDQEEAIFQTARLCNCGWFGAVVFSDYFSTILGLVRYGSNWSLNPFGEFRTDDHQLYERGRGNACSVEFNCLYRWHATTSAEDEQWTQQVFNMIFEGRDMAGVTVDDFKTAARKAQAMQPDIHHWTFGKLKRQDNGSFKDEDLANFLQDATEHPAAAFGARGTPSIFRLNEIMGIEQNRKWGVCSLNDFRKYLGLKPYGSFIEWNSNPEVADAAEKLYGDINHLELYVGLQAEETKPLVEGAGLCPGYTISRAILSDAIALTRGDRFFTHDFTPYNLTAWGFADCQRDPGAYGFGSTLGRLFLRTLPNHYSVNSVYTYFPLMLPDAMKTNLEKLDLLDKYDVSRPKPKGLTKTITKYDQITTILNDKEAFKTPYAARVKQIIDGEGFFPVESDEEQQAVLQSLNGSQDFMNRIGEYFYETTHKLITANSFALVGGKTHGVNLVRDVLRAVPVYWVATDIAGIQLQTSEHPDGVYTPSQLYDMLGQIYAYIFLDVEPAQLMVLEEKVKSYVRAILHHIKNNLSATVGNRLSIAGIVGTVSSIFSKPKKAEYHELIKRLYELGHSTDRLANTILALMIVGTTEMTLALTNMIDMYLGTEDDKDKDKELRALAKEPAASPKLINYVYEAIRLEPPLRGVYRVSSKDQTVVGQSLSKDDRLFLDISGANLNADIFPDPEKVNLTRATKNVVHGDGLFRYLGEDLSVKIMTEVLRAVFGYENLRRAPGQSGKLTRFRDSSHPELRYGYINNNQIITPFPTSFAVQYDTKL